MQRLSAPECYIIRTFSVPFYDSVHQSQWGKFRVLGQTASSVAHETDTVFVLHAHFIQFV